MSSNFTVIEQEVVDQIKKIAWENGIIAGREIKRKIENGELDPTRPITIEFPVGDFIPEQNLPKSAFLLMKLGSLVTKPEIVEGVHMSLLGASVYTGGSAIYGYNQTTNPLAKIMYSLSTVFSGSALANSGVALAARTCRISRPAMVSEVVAGTCLHIGNKAHVAALMLEKKPIPPHLQSPLYLSRETRQVLANNYGKDLAFVMSGGASGMACTGILKSIPIKTIGKYVGISFSVYAYSKLLIGSYRYGRRFWKARKKSRLDPK